MVELASSFSLGEINSLSQLEYLKWQEVLSRFMMQLRKQLIHLAQSFGSYPGQQVNSNCPVFMRFNGAFGQSLYKPININSHNLLRIYYILAVVVSYFHSY